MKHIIDRKRNRLRDYDYSNQGAYFITICTANRSKLFWKNVKYIDKAISPADKFDAVDIVLSEAGKVVDEEIKNISKIYKCVEIKKYCIMPDHLHLIISLHNTDGEETPSIPRIIQQFKGTVTKKLETSIWQKSYYDRILRDDEDFQNHWMYVEMNTRKWAWDEHKTEF